MKVVIAGGSGQLGQVLTRALEQRGDEVVVLSRHPAHTGRFVEWDGRSVGAWASEVDGADAVINLAGRSVNCRYTPANLNAMRDSRVDSTRAVGQAIAQARRPPRVWLQTDTELVLKSRRVIPRRLMDAGFGFDYPEWAASANDLARHARAEGGRR